MPSGRTHDRITLWSLPIVAGVTFERTQSGELTLLVASGFLLGGLMLGPDLDIHSRQYRRWGGLRWLWLPYRKYVRHRSFLSHGPLIGTTVRLLYLAVWLSGLGLGVILGVSIVYQLIGNIADWTTLAKLMMGSVAEFIGRSFQAHPFEFVLFYLGLELGAMTHYLADWGDTARKRWKLFGISGLGQPQKTKRLIHSRRSSRQTPSSTDFHQLELPLDTVDPPIASVAPRDRPKREPQLPQFPPLNRMPDDR
jgi:uncharacterized metal-binding protein